MIKNVNILYALRKNRVHYYEAIGYSKPYADKMYIIILTSLQYGITQLMHIVFFQSYEPMWRYINEKLNILHEPTANIEILEERKNNEIYNDFFGKQSSH